LEQKNNIKLISVDEVACLIKAKTLNSAKKWLHKNNITFQKLGGDYFALGAEVECEILTTYAKNIQKKYPEVWMELLKKIATDDVVYEMLLNKLSKETFLKQPTTKIALKNNKEKELLKSLMN
jgi:hypothetical protein